jgi:hypothetical protein
MLFRDHAPIAVERDAFVDLDAEITGAGAASQPICRRNAAVKRPDIEPPMMIARGLRRLLGIPALNVPSTA